MANITVTDEEISIELTRGEKIGGLLGNLRIPLVQVRSVESLSDPLSAPRGIRSPGLGLPGVAKIGTWRARGVRQYVVARRAQPGVRLVLTGNRYDEVVLSVPDETVRARLLAVTGAPA